MTAHRPHQTMHRSFTDLGVPPVLAGVLAAGGITTPFPIQAATLPEALAGRDILGKGRTGSGKTIAFALPVVARLAATPRAPRPGRPRALILAPTRELASQIEAAIAPLAAAVSLRTMTVYGGVGAQRQIARLRAGVDIVVACPGRLDDHRRQGHVNLSTVEITVVDEADHMSELGFLPVVRRLLDETPSTGQRLLFSATLDSATDALVQRYLHKPASHDADPARPVEVAADHHVLYLNDGEHLPVLVGLTTASGRAIVFTRTKHRARALTRKLVASGVAAVELHGNLAQNKRDRNLEAFASGAATTLVATDIAARGIHVDDVRMVIHADLPAEHKAYLHRSGRTGRAGAVGTIVTLATDAQRADVGLLTRKAGIAPVATRIRPGDPFPAALGPDRPTTAPGPDRRPDHARPAAASHVDGAGSARRRRRPRRAAQPGKAVA